MLSKCSPNQRENWAAGAQGVTVSVVRLGCGGCLGSLLFLAALGGAAIGVFWVGSRLAASPEGAPLVGSEQDGARAQQTLFEIVRRGASRRPPGQRARHDYVLSEGELNAFLARHLGRVAGLSARDLTVRLLGQGTVEVRLRPEVGEAAGAGVSPLLDYLPESWRRTRATVTLRGPLRLETETSRGQAKALRFDIEEAYVGRQRVPVLAVERLVGSPERLGRWPVPDSISAVIVEKGRVVVQTDS
jgi:hypothetical protein